MDARLTGDLLVAAFFSASKPKAREKERLAKGALLKRALEKITDLDADDEIQGIARALRAQGVTPFHWEIEFPEVFRRGGFDVIVGNPPFAGKNTIAEGHADGYLLLAEVPSTQSPTAIRTLAAHFFRRAFTLLKPNGCFGLIATNTIGQGDTRSTGLRWICGHGGTIYRARKRYKWPGSGGCGCQCGSCEQRRFSEGHTILMAARWIVLLRICSMPEAVKIRRARRQRR